MSLHDLCLVYRNVNPFFFELRMMSSERMMMRTMRMTLAQLPSNNRPFRRMPQLPPSRMPWTPSRLMPPLRFTRMISSSVRNDTSDLWNTFTDHLILSTDQIDNELTQTNVKDDVAELSAAKPASDDGRKRV